MGRELKPNEPWCFCPKCHNVVYDYSKPWKRPWCDYCDGRGKISAELVCVKRICGKLKEECTCEH